MAKQKKIKHKKPLGKRFWHLFKNIDMYGKNIVLHYQGNETFNTYIGGFSSLIIFLLIFVYFLLQLKVMLLKEDSNISKNTFTKQLDDDTNVHYIGEAGLKFGLSLVDDNRNQLLNDKSYITYSIRQVSQVYSTDSSGNSFINRTKTKLETEAWDDYFSKVEQAVVHRLGVDEFICPTTTNYTVAANFYAPRFDYIEMKFYKWNSAFSSVTCATDIDSILSEAQLSITIQNSYFDIEDYSEPLKYFLDDQFFWDILPSFRK